MKVRLAICVLCVVTLVLPVHAQDAARMPMPPMSLDLNTSMYPASALRQRLQGRVLVAFNISKRGRISEEVVVLGEPTGVFDNAALSVAKNIRFTVASDWEKKGGPAHRFQLSVLFKLRPCPTETCTAPVSHSEADDFVVVGADAT